VPCAQWSRNSLAGSRSWDHRPPRSVLRCALSATPRQAHMRHGNAKALKDQCNLA
jgi:hypothetical protein